jgi:predicted S18 family serine protease
MNLARRIYLRYAFSRNPKVVEKSLGALEHALKNVNKGQNMRAYYEAVDAYREVVFFLERGLGYDEREHIERECPILTMMTKNPIIADKVIELAGEEAFDDALSEVKYLRQLFPEAVKGIVPKELEAR